jgi:TfoX/Sxy family transcriptional regulator of competence genes
MAWIKVPAEHHPVFRDALPDDPRVETQPMFGGVAAKVNGHIFAGLFGRSAIVQLSDADREAALALDGAGPFDPMGDGRARSDKIMLPEDVFHDPDELRGWIGRAFDFTAQLPRKVKGARKPAAKPTAPKPASAKPASAKQPATAKKPAARPTTRKSPAKRADQRRR